MQESFIIWLQSYLHPTFDSFFEAVTFLGGFQGFTLILAFVVWSLSYSFGCRLFLMTLLAGYLTNFWIKPIVGLPRPYLANPEIIPLVSEKGLYSFPSGHAQNAFLSFAPIAWFLKKRWVTLLAVMMIFLIGFSRIPLGVHYPSDVLGGWLIGALYVWLFVKWQEPIAGWVSNLNTAKKIVLVFLTALLLGSVLVFFGPKDNPLSWQLTALQLFLSANIGWILQNRFVGFEAGGSWTRRLLRFVLAAPVIFFSFHYSKAQPWLVTLAGFWLTLGAPWVFRRIKI